MSFTIVPDAFTGHRLTQLTESYDAAVRNASPENTRIGSTTIRVHGLVHISPDFDDIPTCEPILEACRRVIGRPFKLSSLLVRTVMPGADAQPLHADVKPGEDGWPMLGFIVMIDDFTRDNGATRFLVGEEEVLACGRAGSVIVYDGSALHGHSANRTVAPRRSIQGAYVPL